MLAVVAAGCGGGHSSTSTVTVTNTVTETVTTPTPSGGSATNLVATPSVRHALRLEFVSGSTPTEARKTKGPLKGSVYYGEYRDIRYALAAFDVPLVGTTDQPTLFVQLPGTSYWRVLSDTGGALASDRAIPCPLRKAWGFGCSPQS